jgi:hypothetical protein
MPLETGWRGVRIGRSGKIGGIDGILAANLDGREGKMGGN